MTQEELKKLTVKKLSIVSVCLDNIFACIND